MIKLSFIKYLLFLSGVISSPLFLFSQTVTDSTKQDTILPTYRRLKVAFNYSSANNLLGKKDTISIPLLSPSIKYTTSRDIFYQASIVHTNTTSKLFDELDLKIGYSYYFNDRWNASISYTRYIFSKEVDRLNALVNNDVNLYVGYDWDYVYSALSFDFTSGKKSYTYQTTDSVYHKKLNIYTYTTTSGNASISSKDYTLTLMNSRQFFFFDLIKPNDKLIVSPEIDIYYGTQNAVQTDKSTKKLLKAKKSKSINATTNTSTPFMAYTFNLDLRYTIKRITFNLSPFYTVPQRVKSDVNISSPYFVMYGGIYYTWKWEKK